jgi:hypothetical protein
MKRLKTRPYRVNISSNVFNGPKEVPRDVCLTLVQQPRSLLVYGRPGFGVRRPGDAISTPGREEYHAVQRS